MEFRVGDTVRVKQGYYNAGKIGVVIDLDEWNIWIRVRFDDGSSGWYLPKEIKIIKREKFSLLKQKIGD